MKRLFFQGSGSCVVPAGDGHEAMTFPGRIIWVDADDLETAQRISDAGFEEIASDDERYALAVEKGSLLRCVLKAAGLPVN